MNKTILVTENRKKTSKFQKLWQSAERHKARNARFRQQLDAVVERVRSEVLPTDLETARASKPLLQTLLTLGQRKSLTQWQRAELDDWIQGLVDEMHGNSLIDDALLNDIALYDAFRLGITLDVDGSTPPVEQLVAIIEREAPSRIFSENKHRNFRDSDSCFDAFETFGFYGFENIEFMDFPFGDDSGREGQSTKDEPILADAPVVTNDVVQRLFRSIAAKLHPDREADSSRRKEKQGLMADLLEARKQGDVMTILQFHQKYVGEDNAYSTADEQQLVIALEQNILELQKENGLIIVQSSLHAIVYQSFFSASKKKVDKAIAHHLETAENARVANELMAKEIRSLKTLKPYLQKRYDSKFMVTGFEQFYQRSG